MTTIWSKKTPHPPSPILNRQALPVGHWHPLGFQLQIVQPSPVPAWPKTQGVSAYWVLRGACADQFQGYGPGLWRAAMGQGNQPFTCCSASLLLMCPLTPLLYPSTSMLPDCTDYRASAFADRRQGDPRLNITHSIWTSNGTLVGVPVACTGTGRAEPDTSELSTLTYMGTYATTRASRSGVTFGPQGSFMWPHK